MIEGNRIMETGRNRAIKRERETDKQTDTDRDRERWT